MRGGSMIAGETETLSQWQHAIHQNRERGGRVNAEQVRLWGSAPTSREAAADSSPGR